MSGPGRSAYSPASCKVKSAMIRAIGPFRRQDRIRGGQTEDIHHNATVTIDDDYHDGGGGGSLV